MADTRQWQTSDGSYVNEEQNSREWQTSDGAYINENATAAAGGNPLASSLMMTGVGF